MSNAIAEPARLATCPPLIRELGQATHSMRDVVIDEAGRRRERMPMGVIVTSYFLRAGNVCPSAILRILDRQYPSTSFAGQPPFPLAPGKAPVRRLPRSGAE